MNGPRKTSRDALSKSRSRVLLSRDGLVLFLFSKQEAGRHCPGAGCPRLGVPAPLHPDPLLQGGLHS